MSSGVNGASPESDSHFLVAVDDTLVGLAKRQRSPHQLIDIGIHQGDHEISQETALIGENSKNRRLHCERSPKRRRLHEHKLEKASISREAFVDSLLPIRDESCPYRYPQLICQKKDGQSQQLRFQKNARVDARTTSQESVATTPSSAFVDEGTIVSIGTCFGISAALEAFSTDAVKMIGRVVEFRLRLVISKAEKCSRHSIASFLRPVALTFQNVFSAMEILQISLGKDNGGAPYFKAASLQGISADRVKNRWGSNSITSDVTVDLREFAQKHHVDPISMPYLALSWLAIDGKVVAAEHNSKSFHGKNIEDPQYHLKLRLPDRLSCIMSWERTLCELTANHAGYAQSDYNSDCKHSRSLQVVSQVDKIVHPISREHLMLLHQLRDILRKPIQNSSFEYSDTVKRAIQSIQTSPGLRQIVPYLVSLEATQIALCLSWPDSLAERSPAAGIRVAIRALVALAQNVSVDFQYSMHQVVQIIQLIVIHPLLAHNSISFQESLGLRLLAAKALNHLVGIFCGSDGGFIGLGDAILSVYSRIIHDADQPLTTILGAVIGLRCLGYRALRSILVPAAPYILELLSIKSKMKKHAHEPPKKVEPEAGDEVWWQIHASLVFELMGAISDSLGPRSTTNRSEVLYHDINDSLVSRAQTTDTAFENLVAVLGDSLVPFTTAGERRHATIESASIPTPAIDWSTTFI